MLSNHFDFSNFRHRNFLILVIEMTNSSKVIERIQRFKCGNYGSSTCDKSDSKNKSPQQQLPPILHDNKLPVVKKLDGKAGKAEKWQIACENGFGRMIPAIFNYIISIMARNDLIIMICQILNSYVQRSCARVY